MLKNPSISLLILIALVAAACKPNKPVKESPKDIVYKKKLDAYTEVQYGNMPLIISVPHGGTDNPTTLPDRNCPNITTVTDNGTIEMVAAIDSVCRAEYNVQPYLVISYLKRTKLDLNREITEATCGNSAVAGIYNNYHYSIDSFIAKLLLKYPQVLFIDLHGHGHTKQRIELGYLVSASQLRNPAAIAPSSTSYYNMLLQNPFLNSNQFLTAANAFGTLLAEKNIPTVPSAQDPAPLTDDPYFDGGYNTKKYTAAAYPKVYGWQLEANYTGVRDNKTNRIKFAKAFLQSVMEFYSRNTSMQPAGFGK
jgi:N-formylglutamate amidohydrolase